MAGINSGDETRLKMDEYLEIIENEFKKEFKKENGFSIKQVPGTNLINICDHLIIDPQAYLQINDHGRKDLINILCDFCSNVNTNSFEQRVEKFCTHYRIGFEKKRTEHKKKIRDEVFNQNDYTVFEIDKLPAHEIDRLNKVFRDAGRTYNPKALKVGIKFAKELKCKNVVEFCAAFEYILRQMDKKAALAYNQDKDNQKKGKKEILKNVYDNYLQDNDEKYLHEDNEDNKSIKKDFLKLMEKCDKENNEATPKFSNSMAAANHYDKHNIFPNLTGVPNNPIEIHNYFHIARTYPVRNSIMKEQNITQDGTGKCYTATDFIKAIKIVQYSKNSPINERTIATCMTIKKKKNKKSDQPTHETSQQSNRKNLNKQNEKKKGNKTN
jgi:hypothetical protein